MRMVVHATHSHNNTDWFKKVCILLETRNASIPNTAMLISPPTVVGGRPSIPSKMLNVLFTCLQNFKTRAYDEHIDVFLTEYKFS